MLYAVYEVVLCIVPQYKFIVAIITNRPYYTPYFTQPRESKYESYDLVNTIEQMCNTMFYHNNTVKAYTCSLLTQSP